MFNAKTVKNIVSKEEVSVLLDFARSIEKWEDAGDEYWSNRALNGPSIYNDHSKEIGKLLYDIKNRVGKQIKESYNLNEEVYADIFQIVRWFPGMQQSPHCDDMTDQPNPDLDWFKHRHFGAIVYLNDDYDGGHTYYPQYNLYIKPESGMLAVHPGDPYHMHGVTKIENEMRYTLASFWTFDKEYDFDWSIHE